MRDHSPFLSVKSTFDMINIRFIFFIKSILTNSDLLCYFEKNKTINKQ